MELVEMFRNPNLSDFNHGGGIILPPQPDPMLWQSIERMYQDLGGENGFLGRPSATHGGAYSDDGSIYAYQYYLNDGLITAHPSFGTHEIHGLIYKKWESFFGLYKGGLGLPLTDVSPAAGGGLFSIFQYGDIYWHPSVDAYGVYGAIRDKWYSLSPDLKNSFGYPITDTLTKDGQLYNHFQGGSIYWHPDPIIGAHEVHGAIRDKWFSLSPDLKNSFGYPTSDESTRDNIGRFNEFQGGSIYWHPDPAVGVHEVHGAIREKWYNLSPDLKNKFGYPISDERNTRDNIGRFNEFQNGAIYWHPDPAVGAHEVHGAIRQKWSDMRWEQGPLGYPISDVMGNRQNFEKGFIELNITGNPIAYVRPVANFITDHPSGDDVYWYAGSPIQFTSQSVGQIDSYIWSFGDGTNDSTISNPKHTYNNPGEYLAILTVSNRAGTSNYSRVIRIRPQPQQPCTNFFFRMANGDPCSVRPCFNYGPVCAQDEQSAKREAERLNGGYRATKITEQQFIEPCNPGVCMP